MSCPTCDGTMHALGCKVTDRPFFFCPRCGTVKPCEEVEAVAPALVERCCTFARHLFADAESVAELQREWHRLGIAESIALPAERKPPCP